jgi:hypothetical protein
MALEGGGADSGRRQRVGDKEDAPARLVFFFDGQSSNLSIGDRAEMVAASAAGDKLPYATLMYIWTNSAPVGTVIPNPHTSRVQMIVVGSEPGKWQNLRRNVASDFERVFHEARQADRLRHPDRYRQHWRHARAWYGDIRFPRRSSAAGAAALPRCRHAPMASRIAVARDRSALSHRRDPLLPSR